MVIELDPVLGKEMFEERSKSIVPDETVVSAGRDDCKEFPEFGVNEVSSVDEATSVDIYKIDAAKIKKLETNNFIDLFFEITFTIFIEDI
jgi:hypothetical protein